MQWNNLGSQKDFQPLSEDPAQSPSLPGLFYNRPDILDAEKEKIFYKSWQLVAHVTQLQSPGDFVCAQIADENIFVNLDPEATPLEILAGEMFEDIRANAPWWDEMVISPELSSGESEDGTLDANWKVLAENCLECYHCDPSHPAYVDLIDMKTYDWELHGTWLKSFGNLKKSENKAYNVDPTEPCQVGIYWFLWPNIEISIVPGEKALSSLTFYPVSPDLTHSASIILTCPGETVKQDRIDYRWHTLWAEDVGICEAVHRGLQSQGYHQGRFVIDPDLPGVSEYGAHHFQLRYTKAMEL